MGDAPCSAIPLPMLQVAYTGPPARSPGGAHHHVAQDMAVMLEQQAPLGLGLGIGSGVVTIRRRGDGAMIG